MKKMLFISILMLGATTACGTAAQNDVGTSSVTGANSSAQPGTQGATAGVGNLSRSEACDKVVLVVDPVLTYLFPNEEPNRTPAWIAKAKDMSRQAARELRDVAQQTKDAETRKVFEDYSTRVLDVMAEYDFKKPYDISSLPFLDLGEHCVDDDPVPSGKPEVTHTPTPSPKPSSTTTSPRQSVIQQAFVHINAYRKERGRKPYLLDTKLNKVAQAHSDKMAAGCGLEDRCNGEADLLDRFAAFGVTGGGVAEIIHQGSAENNTASIAAATTRLTDQILHEAGPGHESWSTLGRSSFPRIGIAVTRDSKGRLWLTQTFSD